MSDVKRRRKPASSYVYNASSMLSQTLMSVSAIYGSDKSLKASLFFTLLANCPNRNSPIDSGEEANKYSTFLRPHLTL